MCGCITSETCFLCCSRQVYRCQAPKPWLSRSISEARGAKVFKSRFRNTSGLVPSQLYASEPEDACAAETKACPHEIELNLQGQCPYKLVWLEDSMSTPQPCGPVLLCKVPDRSVRMDTKLVVRAQAL